MAALANVCEAIEGDTVALRVLHRHPIQAGSTLSGQGRVLEERASAEDPRCESWPIARKYFLRLGPAPVRCIATHFFRFDSCEKYEAFKHPAPENLLCSPRERQTDAFNHMAQWRTFRLAGHSRCAGTGQSPPLQGPSSLGVSPNPMWASSGVCVAAHSVTTGAPLSLSSHPPRRLFQSCS